MPLSQLGGGEASSSWGWTDPDTHKEYALLGRTTGTSFVDVSDPKAPVYLGNLPSHTGTSLWRELKTYGYYALIVSDANGAHGLQIFDLRELRNVVNPPVQFSESAHYPGFDTGHTITVNPDTGFAYVNGSNTCDGGPHIVDVRDALHPEFAGCVDEDGYTHDSQCVTYHGPDTTYTGDEICFNANEDTLTIVDVTDKSNPAQLARQGYLDFGYTHQGWLTEDHQYLVVDDEFDEVDFAHTAYTYIWDVRDLNSPQLIGTYKARFRAIDHNQYIVGDRLYQANYRAGLHVLDMTNVATGQLREVGYFDIYPADDSPQFNAAWNVYPFHSNGVVTISGIEQGLFVVKVQPEPNPPPCSNKPAKGTLDSPAENATPKKLRVRLKWNANACASEYKVIVREKTGAGKIVVQKETTTETQFKTMKLEPGRTYRWTIRPCNGWGCAKGTSRTFTTK
jgi:choice-of-anchor B domain-containing protein